MSMWLAGIAIAIAFVAGVPPIVRTLRLLRQERLLLETLDAANDPRY